MTMAAKRYLTLVVLVALAGAVMARPIAIPSAPFVLGLVALALVSITDPHVSRLLALIPANHPPRRPRAR